MTGLLAGIPILALTAMGWRTFRLLQAHAAIDMRGAALIFPTLAPMPSGIAWSRHYVPMSHPTTLFPTGWMATHTAR
ncbi:hypothetical protein [Nocardia tengchongensis]|uniref:hypothetical protein n=1 Tax=Nocardia tengchongensis TaxID=2055889 RepID=UPI00365A601F